jgi:hypothetical protein
MEAESLQVRIDINLEFFSTHQEGHASPLNFREYDHALSPFESPSIQQPITADGGFYSSPLYRIALTD